MNVRRRGLLAIVLACVLVLSVGRVWGAVIGDHAWFDALGFVDVWWWRTSVALTLKCGAGVLASLVMRAHLEAVRRSFVSVVVPGSIGNQEYTAAVPDRTISLVLWCIALAVGVLLTIPVDDWVLLANVLDARAIGESDPYFQYDLSFWTSWLPFEVQAYTWSLLSHAVMSLLTVAGYVLTRGIGTDGRAVRVTRHARRHVTVLGAMLLLLIAWSYRLDGFDRLVHGSGADGTFGFTDHRVGLPGGIVMQVIALAAAGVVTWSAWSRQPRAAIAAVTTVLLMALLLRQGMPLLADSVDGGEDPEAREQRYIGAGASYTRRAYEADRVVVALPADTASLVTAPVWDRATLPQAAPGRVAALHGWNAGDDAPQAIAFTTVRSGGLLPTWRPVTLDMSAADPRRARTNDAPSPVLPPLVVTDSGRGYAIVSDPAHRIAAPSIANLSARLAHAWNQQNPRLLFGKVPQPSPVLVTVRDVRERVAQLVPTLQGGSHVIPVLHADSLLWVLDLYAVSETYPLSQRVPLGDATVSAAQFAATALVNAHSGRVTLVTEAEPSLLARGMMRRYTRHVVRATSLPDGLRRSLPPRGDAIDLEASVAARFGSRAVQDDTTAAARIGVPLDELALVRGLSADSSVGSDDYVPVWMPARRAYALTSAAIDARGIVRGVIIAPGGVDRRTRWRASAAGVAYDSVLRGVKETSDSLRQPGSLAGARRGTTRVLPGSGAPRFVTPFVTLRDGRPTQLAAVLLGDGIRRVVAPDMGTAAVEWRSTGRPVGAGGAAAILYRQMRDALVRGAWSEFGAAFEALGRSLGVPRDSSPR